MMENANNNEFIGYEYKEVTIPRSMDSFYTDGYANFGWQPEGSSPTPYVGKIVMKYKRNRKLRNKAEITRLQRKFDACAEEIQAMERSKKSAASLVAYTLGLIGTAFLAGATFAYLAQMIALCIVLAIPGFAGWILPYFCFVKLRASRTAKLNPLIEKKYDEMYETCEKANALLAE